jgi:hypothetical protein
MHPASIPLIFKNEGFQMATSVKLIATLEDRLTYLGDTSGIPPLVEGNQLT